MGKSSVITANEPSIYEEGEFENQMFGHRTEVQWCNSVEGRTSAPFFINTLLAVRSYLTI